MKSIKDYIYESQDFIDIDNTSPNELNKIIHTLSKEANRQGYHISDDYFRMAFKRLYGVEECVYFSDIKFATVENNDVMVIYFKNRGRYKGIKPLYYDIDFDDWQSYIY